MSKSYRLRTKVGVDKSVRVNLEQDFEFLEILSLKILQSQIYTRPCSDYGVVVGRIFSNGGFGIPNAKVSIFIPLSNEDENNPVISEIYPYKSLSSLNEDGYRYNLLPYVQQHGGHTPTGTFFDREDVLINNTLIEVYDKYYKYTARTNQSGDYMIFGVPLGSQTIHIDIDLSDIGEFSLFPQDLIRMGRATPSQVAGTRFKFSTNLGELPQIVSINREVLVEPLWGEDGVCNIGITRADIDLTEGYNIKLEPTAIFMGSLISSDESYSQKRNCKPKLKQGKLCNMVSGPGEIIAIRQTIFQDVNGRPGLEVYDLEEGNQVIDDNGTWMIDVPMNLDYVITNEFGQQVLSYDPKVGVPTRAKYRFKIKWNQPPTLREPVKRGYFLVPNIKEHGWNSSSPTTDPLRQPTGTTAYQTAIRNYAFSLDWEDYGDSTTSVGQQMIQDAIDAKDKFYEFSYNKVYTVSQFIDQFRTGSNRNRIIAIKDILDDTCESDNAKFPTNDSTLRWDIVYILFIILFYPIRYILYILLIVAHILAFLVWLLIIILILIVAVILYPLAFYCLVINTILQFLDNTFGIGPGSIPCISFGQVNDIIESLYEAHKFFTHLNLPNLTYPDCELCNCKIGEGIEGSISTNPLTSQVVTEINNFGANNILSSYWDGPRFENFPGASEPTLIGGLMSGYYVNTNSPTSYSRAPQSVVYGSNLLFTTSLTIAERINLFNTKAKYFDDSVINPGGGVNRIKVTFNTDLNPYTTKYHWDNVMVLSCRDGFESTFPAGQLITFQDLATSSDFNLTAYTQVNQFGTNAITGTPVGTIVSNTYTTTNVTVPFAHPNGGGNTTTLTPSPYTAPTYVITGKTDDVNYHKFPMDVEYFQVITAMTHSDFVAQVGGTIPNSLNSRFLDNDMKFEELEPNGCWVGPFNYNPIDSFQNGDKQVIVFLVRGVDPNSTRTKVRYDMSILFGNPLNTNVVEGDYKLNIPIQGSYKPTNHADFITDAFLPSDTYGNIPLYYDSYHFQPAIVGTASFSAFTSTYPTYYSHLSSTNPTFAPTNPINPPLSVVCTNNPVLGYTINSNWYENGFTQDFTSPYLKQDCEPFPNFCTSYNPTNNGTTNNKGYFTNEIVDGGSLFRQYIDPATFGGVSYCGTYEYKGFYYSPRYSITVDYPLGLGASGRQIVMRSDRLPTSSTPQENAGNSMVLQSNALFAMFQVDDNGVSTPSQGTTAGTPNVGGNDDDQTDSLSPSIFDSFTCQGLVPLDCYDTTSTGELIVKPKPDPCYENGLASVNEIMEGGCYVLITEIMLTLFNGKDFKLLAEWASRMQVSFAACRNTWSHLFTNSWINGTLYAFPINNDRFFSPFLVTIPNPPFIAPISPTNPFCPPNGGPCLTEPNKPYSDYCRKTVILEPNTKSYYYRCSPYDDNTLQFIGGIPAPQGGNERNILFPTTIMDLGPKNVFIQELVMSDEYDGYVVNKIPQTTYKDIEEILNLFIISRIANTKFWKIFLGAGGASALSYFNKRDFFMVDADYAQSIGVNSELGVSPFQAENYPAIPASQDPVFFNGADADDGVFGIFFSSDTQLRDWITPKRTNIVLSANPASNCAFNNYGVYSQEVPFYQWFIKQNSGGASTPLPNSIFGSQANEWYTNPSVSPTSNGFFSFPYQSMDRLNQQCRYFRPTNTVTQTFLKGYIYAVTPASTFASFEYDPGISAWNLAPVPPLPQRVTVGAPFHFYFGLKKGKTAWDRFAKKWLNLEEIED